MWRRRRIANGHALQSKHSSARENQSLWFRIGVREIVLEQDDVAGARETPKQLGGLGDVAHDMDALGVHARRRQALSDRLGAKRPHEDRDVAHRARLLAQSAVEL